MIKYSYILLILPLVISYISTLFIDKNQILKSPKYPPPYVFGVVWTILYLILGYILFYSYENNLNNIFIYFSIYILGLVTWYLLFNGQGSNKKYGTVSLIILLIGAIFNTIQLSNYNTNLSLLMIPNIVWLCYATYLYNQ